MTVINFIASFIKHTHHKISFYILCLFEDIAILPTSFKPFFFIDIQNKFNIRKNQETNFMISTKMSDL